MFRYINNWNGEKYKEKKLRHARLHPLRLVIEYLMQS